VARGSATAPDRAQSHSSGHRALPGQGKSPSVAVVPVRDELARTDPPEDLPAVAAGTWRAILSDMAALRTLREVDMPLVLAFCEAAYVHHEASAIIHKAGVMIKGDHGPTPNPMLRVQKDAAGTMRQLADVLGLNPMARIRGNLMEVSGQSLALGIRDRHQELAHRRLRFLARRVAALRLPAALLGLDESAAALGADLARPSLDPEPLAALRAALGRVHSDVGDVLPAALAALPHVTLHGASSRSLLVTTPPLW